jgi:hypothetical protein
MTGSRYKVPGQEPDDDLVNTDSRDQASRPLATAYVQAEEAHREATIVAKQNAKYMLWSVVTAAMSAVITALSLAFVVLNFVYLI